MFKSILEFFKTETCWNCNGSGKLRANYTDSLGRYVLHKIPCYTCKGKGELNFLLKIKERLFK